MSDFQQRKNLDLLRFAEDVLKGKSKSLYNEFMAVFKKNDLTKDELLDLMAKDNTNHSLKANSVHYVVVPYFDHQPGPSDDVSFCSFLVETTDGVIEIPCGEVSREIMYLDYQDASIVDESRLRLLEEALKKQMADFNKLLADFSK